MPSRTILLKFGLVPFGSYARYLEPGLLADTPHRQFRARVSPFRHSLASEQQDRSAQIRLKPLHEPADICVLGDLLEGVQQDDPTPLVEDSHEFREALDSMRGGQA